MSWQVLREQIFSALLGATTRKDILSILETIQSEGIKVGWRNVGDRPINYPTVHMTSSPIVSLVERITNAIDAIFEKYAEETPESKKIRSPRTFAEEVIGFTDNLLPESVKRRKKYSADSSGISVNLWDGDDENTPTVDVRDNGIGLTRSQFPDGILSLNKSNKIIKWFVMGQFGQGGSTALAFSEYTIILSKRFDGAANEFAFTIVKREPRANDQKFPTYVYLVDKKDELPPRINPGRPNHIPFNTIVKHINYRMGKQNLFSLYNKLHYFLFDPVIPFKIVNHKIVGAKQEDGGEEGHERAVFGSRSRLNRTPLIESKDEIVYPLKNPDLGSITLRYWLFKRRTDDQQKETFVEPANPIVITYFGQSHDTLPRRDLNDCKLPYVQKDLVIQVDCDGINNEGKDIFLENYKS